MKGKNKDILTLMIAYLIGLGLLIWWSNVVSV